MTHSATLLLKPQVVDFSGAKAYAMEGMFIAAANNGQYIKSNELSSLKRQVKIAGAVHY